MDWYGILFLGVVLLLFYIESYGEHIAFDDYVHHASTLGLNNGTMSLTIRCSTSLFLLWSVWLTIETGLLSAGIIAIGLLFLYFFLSHFISPQATTHKGEGLVWKRWIESRMPSREVKLSAGINMVLSTGKFLIEWQFTSYLFLDVLSLPWYSVLIIFPCFLFVFSGLGGITGIFKTNRILIYISYFALMFVPFYFYMVEGTTSIYQSLEELNVPLYPGNLTDLLFWFYIMLTGGIGVFLMDVYIWQSASRFNAIHKSTIHRLSYITTMAIPFSIMIFVYFLLSMGVSRSVEALLKMLTGADNLLVLFIVIIWLSTLSIGMSISLFQLTSLLSSLRTRVSNSSQNTYYLSLILAFGVPLVSYLTYSHFPEMVWLVYFGYLACLIPFLSLKIRRIQAMYIPYTAGLAWGLAIFLYMIDIHPFLVSISTLFISCLLLTLQILLNSLFSEK